ncbi:MAG: hypothetical protein J6S67_13995 [Methanobrevibacter sp.]|nr:hypothetical protein [Methanobrevibacter sp.]
MNLKEQEKWERLIKKYPELAGTAYELYVRHEQKNANVSTYFMWAGKLERQTEKRYRNGLKKYCEKQKIKMELKKND